MSEFFDMYHAHAAPEFGLCVRSVGVIRMLVLVVKCLIKIFYDQDQQHYNVSVIIFQLGMLHIA
jgi:hypothetical protein